MQVHHCNDHKLARFDPENDSERERHRETAPNAVLNFAV